MGLVIPIPSALSVTLAEFRVHLVESVSATDALLTQTLTEATEWVQSRTNLCLLPATCIQTWDQFPHTGNRHGVHDHMGGNFWHTTGASYRRMPLRIDVQPVTSITSVQYYDSAGTLTTLSSSTDYWTALHARPPKIVPQNGWPFAQLGRPESVQVTFVAGFADAAHVPNTAKLAIKQLASFWFIQRSAVTTRESSVPTATYPAYGDIPFGVESLCQQLDQGGYT